MQKELYSVAEFCGAFGISKSAFYAEVRAGRLHTVKMGASTRVKRADALAWVESLPPTAAA